MDKQKSALLRTTLFVLLGLAALTAIEFWVSQLETPSVALIIISLLKASMILYYFMAVNDLWSGENH